MARRQDAVLLGPLVVDEILIRFLQRPSVLAWHRSAGRNPAFIELPRPSLSIRAHFAQPVTVDDMAASVRMSASSFHERFKAVTSMSPLQYQKVLRLHEAAADAVPGHGTDRRLPPGRLPESVAVQQGIQSILREYAKVKISRGCATTSFARRDGDR